MLLEHGSAGADGGEDEGGPEPAEGGASSVQRREDRRRLVNDIARGLEPLPVVTLDDAPPFTRDVPDDATAPNPSTELTIRPLQSYARVQHALHHTRPPTLATCHDRHVVKSPVRRLICWRFPAISSTPAS